jgi:phospholipid/cholesterol/gamma-HCH transport system ATP-binding protein
MPLPGEFPAIQVAHVALSFNDHAVLEDVSLELPAGGTLVLMGVTASGKSVLLKLMLGLLKPDSGRIVIEGQDTAALTESEFDAVRRRMGIVFQEGALFDSLSVYENVSYPLWEQGERDEGKIEARVREVLGFVELEEAIDKMPAQLSGGMRRRVAIARAIASAPDIMLYDSPTAGLDPMTSHTINALVVKLRDTLRVSSVVVTNRLQDAAVLANFVYAPDRAALVPLTHAGGIPHPPPTECLVLRDGLVYFAGPLDEMKKTRDPYLHGFLG